MTTQAAEAAQAQPSGPCGARAPLTAVSLTMCDGTVSTILLPAVIPAHDEVRRYMREGIGVATGAGQETFYPPHSIVKITVDRKIAADRDGADADRTDRP